MVKCCPTCGHPIPENELLHALSNTQRKLFVSVQRAGRAGIRSEVLLQQMYQDDPSGGPEAPNILYVFKSKMQYVLRQFGLKLVVSRGNWHLEKIG